VPRELKQLPRWGYARLIDAPSRSGKPKPERVWNSNKQGMSKRQNGNLDYRDVGRRPSPPLWRPDFNVSKRRRGDIIRYDVSCTICLDQGCDHCPVVEEE
jgi:hypothetical protein